MTPIRRPTILAALASLVVGITAACSSATAPVPAKLFHLAIVNHFNQFGGDATATEADSALFVVYALNGVSRNDLARIESMDVVWPDGTTMTELPSTFEFKVSGTTSSAELAEDATLPAGTYTLEVTFKGGQQVATQADFGGQTIPPIKVVDVRDEILDGSPLLTLDWVAPDVPHSYRLALLQAGDTVATSGTVQFEEKYAGDTLGHSVSYTPIVGTTYDLVLLLSNPNTLRAVHTEFVHQQE